MTPRVSIVMPCLNGERHVLASVRSVFAQTLADFELIFVDNGSTDRSLAIVSAIRDPRLRVLQQPERGVSRARNLGIEQAQAPLLAFLDSDDTWDARFLEKMCDALEADPSCVLAYCGWHNLGLSGGRGEPYVPPDHEGPARMETLLEGCLWPIHGCITRTATIRAAGSFDTGFTIGEDYLLWMEVCLRGPIRRVPEVLAHYHHHDSVQATKNLGLALLDPFRAKLAFLDRHPEVRQAISRARLDELTWARLIRDANQLYWQGHLAAVRPVFRKILAAGKGTWRDHARMLPSLMPLPLHRLLSRLTQPAP
jgi:glycosyltransferase involved in cell wall biosynthesis